MGKLDRLLEEMIGRQATDLHLSAGEPVRLRLQGELTQASKQELNAEQLTQLLKESLSEEQWQRLNAEQELDFAYRLEGRGRFRGHCFAQRRGLQAHFRIVSECITPLDEMHLPPTVLSFVEADSGLVLVTGPAGSGKSTTLAGLIDAINRRKTREIIIIEDPIEFIHQNNKSYIIQREIGTHVPSFSQALRDALCEDPDVLVVGELRDLETLVLALAAAEMGLLVFGTLPTTSAAKSVERIATAFPPEEQSQIRGTLSESLLGIISAQLLTKKDGSAKVPAVEILKRVPGLASLIRDGNESKLTTFIDNHRSLGMQTLDFALQQLIEQDIIDAREAYRKCNQKQNFERWLLERGMTKH